MTSALITALAIGFGAGIAASHFTRKAKRALRRKVNKFLGSGR